MVSPANPPTWNANMRLLLYWTSGEAYCANLPVLLSRVLLGPQPLYIIADMDLVKEITVKQFDKFADRVVSATLNLCTLLHVLDHSLLYIAQCM